LNIESGETCVVIGPSGCGKSTLLRTANGLVYPDTGSVTVAGERVDRASVRTLRHSIGYAIQGAGLFPHLTAQQNVSLPASHLSRDRSSIEERVAELCDLTRFPRTRLNAFPNELSGGQQQRVALMRALMLDPPILLLDEPLGALDPMIRSELQADLRAIIKSLGKTVVFVTHDLPEASHFADRIVLMRTGRIVQVGTVDELVQSPANDFVRAFITAQKSLTFDS
ncbi:MAG: ATP-binding cassette domain-containing protein, partial [Rhodothermales bacterium]|nr:ATP-binding cassette domain-containing protein [Rhodothermales bacterium]